MLGYAPRLSRIVGLGFGAVLGWLMMTGVSAASPQSDDHIDFLPHVAARLARHETVRIVAFGSSSTAGVGASSPQASYPSQLAADLSADLGGAVSVTVVNRGVSGEDADDMLSRLDRDVVAAHPDLVIWQTGSNDPLRNVPVERFAADTKAGIARLRAADIDVMLMGPQYCPRLETVPTTPRYRAVLRAVAAQFRVPLIARYDLMRQWLASGAVGPAALLAPDGLHMGDAGYAQLAQAVARTILADSGLAHAVTARASGAATR